MKKTKSLNSGIKDEVQMKSIVKQMASALEFMHLSFQIVHGNVKPQNVLVFNPDFSQVKLCDFGSAETEGNHVPRGDSEDPSYFSPEMADVLPGEKYYVSMASDAWQLGILLYYCAHARTPWSTPDITDANYSKYYDWVRRKSLRMPSSFGGFSPRLIRLMKRLLEPKPSKRHEVKEVFKYLKDDWFLRPKKKGLLRRQSEVNLEERPLIVGRPRSVSASPALNIRRASSTSTNISANISDSFPLEHHSSFKTPNRKKSLKTVQFDISEDERSLRCNK
jgi:serine/threonine protein kinase